MCGGLKHRQREKTNLPAEDLRAENVGAELALPPTHVALLSYLVDMAGLAATKPVRAHLLNSG
ncbi:hypothetical protein ALON55S_07265 [Alishewanella longhuensis]